jgi:UDP-glucuronate 4-epimerase
MSKPVIIVTGAAGFIGSHAATSFLERGYRVVGVDNFCDFYPRPWKDLNVRSVAKAGGADFSMEELDIVDGPAVGRLMAAAKPAAVLHLAAMAGVRPSIERPAHYANVNVTGTVNLLESAVRNGVGRFLFASSSSVYGNNPKVPFAETDCVDEPISPYAATKRAGELIAHSYWNLYKLPVFCLRFFTVYGPRQRPDLAIHKFTRLIAEGKPVPFFGGGSTSRDYTYVADIVAGINAALDKCDRYRIYNLGGSSPIMLKELVEQIAVSVGKKAVLDRRPMQPGDVERTYADVSRSSAELGYKPKVTIDEGIRRFVQWFREEGHLYA